MNKKFEFVMFLLSVVAMGGLWASLLAPWDDLHRTAGAIFFGAVFLFAASYYKNEIRQ